MLGHVKYPIAAVSLSLLALCSAACREPRPAAGPVRAPVSAVAPRPRAAVPSDVVPADAHELVEGASSETFLDPARVEKLSATFPAVDRAVSAALERMKLPGLAVAVVIDGHVAHVATAGYRDIAAKSATDAETIYRIGSVTKTVTATAILQLRDAGKLDLDVPAARYLPALAKVRYPTRDAALVTLRHLLTHTSGLPRDGGFDSDRTDRDVTEAEMLAAVSGMELEAAPGARYSYSNFGFSLLGLVVTHVAGQPYRDYVKAHVFEPLGMASAGWTPAQVAAEKLATPYRAGPDGALVAETSYGHLGASEADGGLYLSVQDLGRFIGWQLAAYPARDEPEDAVLRRASLREMHAGSRAVRFEVGPDETEHPRFLAKGRATSVGFAWHSHSSCDFDSTVAHDGFVDRYMTNVGFLPAQGVGIVVLTNTGFVDLGPVWAEVLAPLRESGALQARARVKSSAPELERALERLLFVMNGWDDAKYLAMLSAGHREHVRPEAEKAELASYAERHGRCTAGKLVRYDNPRSARMSLSCERGRFEMDLNLEAATGLIDGFTGFSSDVPASKLDREGAERGLALLNHWNGTRYEKAFSATFRKAIDLAAFAKQHLKRHGSCTLGAPGERDGAGWQRFALSCQRGVKVELAVHVGATPTAEISGLRIDPMRHGACAER